MGQKYTNSLEAWEYFRRGTEFYRKYTQQDNARARELFEKAISLDPQFARAYASLSATHRQDWTYRWRPDINASMEHAQELADQAIAVDSSLPHGHSQRAYVHVYKLKHKDALTEALEAVRLDPNDADGYATLALIRIYSVELGDRQKADNAINDAIAEMKTAIRLNPHHPAYYLYHLGLAYYVKGQYDKAQYDEAKEYLEKVLDTTPNFRPALGYLVAIYYKLKNEVKSNEMRNKLIALNHPRGLAERRRLSPFKDDTITTEYVNVWRALGEPENP